MTGRAAAGLLIAGLALLAAAPPPPAAVSPPVTPSWNGWRWAARAPVSVGANVSPAWAALLAPPTEAWSAGPVPLRLDPGQTAPTECAPVPGSIQICSGDYGATGWLGYTDVWVTGRQIVMVRIRLNDHYFGPGSGYAGTAWRRMTICQELGHALGLAHVDEARDNINLGTCMDYSATPAGGGSAGPANLAPGAGDFAGLAAIYADGAGSVPLAAAAGGQASRAAPPR